MKILAGNPIEKTKSISGQVLSPNSHLTQGRKATPGLRNQQTT